MRIRTSSAVRHMRVSDDCVHTLSAVSKQLYILSICQCTLNSDKNWVSATLTETLSSFLFAVYTRGPDVWDTLSPVSLT